MGLMSFSKHGGLHANGRPLPKSYALIAKLRGSRAASCYRCTDCPASVRGDRRSLFLTCSRRWKLSVKRFNASHGGAVIVVCLRCSVSTALVVDAVIMLLHLACLTMYDHRVSRAVLRNLFRRWGGRNLWRLGAISSDQVVQMFDLGLPGRRFGLTPNEAFAEVLLEFGSEPSPEA